MSPASSPDVLLRLLDVDDRGDDHFVGNQPVVTDLPKVYGGQLFAQALAAMARTSPAGRRVHAAQATFLAAGELTRPIELAVVRDRDGGSFSARSVVASQEGRPLLRASASFQVSEPGLAHSRTAPAAPGPDGLPSLVEVIGRHSVLEGVLWREEWSSVEVRYVDALVSGAGAGGPGRQQVWMRVNHEVPTEAATQGTGLHHLLLAYLSDLTLINVSLLPHGIVMGHPDLPRATLNHCVWFHDDVDVTQWFLVDQTSEWAGAGRGLARAEIFQDSRHVASYAQEGLIRPHGELRTRLLDV